MGEKGEKAGRDGGIIRVMGNIRIGENIRVWGVGFRNVGIRETDKLVTLVRIIIMTIAIIQRNINKISWQ